jgi:magnesium transporter
MENFYITIENNEDRIELLVADSNTVDKPEVIESIERNREGLNFLKRSIVPLRDALYTLKSMQDDEEFTEIDKSNYIFFTRLHQKCLEILDQIDYDMYSLESASNVFFSSQSQRMNQIMKTLTIFSAIFLPLTFIAGVYGMNFDYMPELRSRNAYFIVLGGMFVIAVVMIAYFKRKKWF